MVNKVNKEIQAEGNNLLQYGTWAYLGSPSKDSSRYLFWTSIDTNQVGAGKKIPVIVSKADGGFIYLKRQQLIEILKTRRIMLQSQIIFIMIMVFKHIPKGEKYSTLKGSL